MFQRLRRFLFSPTAIWLYVATNGTVFIVIAGWIFSDARIVDTAVRLRGQIGSPLEFASGQINDTELAASVLKLKVLVIVAAVSGLFIVAAAIFGLPHHRRIHSWLSLTFIAAVWLTLWATWSDLMWSGQKFRLQRETGSFQALAESLNNDWPEGDSSRAGIGPFNAYPTSKPRVLQLLTEQRTARGTTFSSIERFDDGSLSFRLTGRNEGAWLECRPSHDSPQSFVGGLDQPWDMDRFAPLGNDWFLVRYKFVVPYVH